MHRMPRIIWWPLRITWSEDSKTSILIRVANLSGIAHVFCVGDVPSNIVREMEEMTKEEFLPAIIKAMSLA